jgi:hypothetical protein
MGLKRVANAVLDFRYLERLSRVLHTAVFIVFGGEKGHGDCFTVAAPT